MTNDSAQPKVPSRQVAYSTGARYRAWAVVGILMALAVMPISQLPPPAALAQTALQPAPVPVGDAFQPSLTAVAARRAAPEAAAVSVPAAGCGSPGAIGLSRTVEIDTTNGPRYGHQQYKDIDFLQDGDIVLTFDDGPLRPYTVPVLKALEAHCTKATFFVVGRMALADPELVRDTARRGHTIGTHTFSHADARRLGHARARADAELGLSAVSRALGQSVAPFFRFPYLSAPDATEDYLRSRQIGVFSIDVDGYDYKTKNPGVVHRLIVSQLTQKRKGILLFHDIQPSTAGAIGGLLSDLKARGFKVVHIVPKAQVATLAEFDTMANKEAARRTAAGPLANRSIVLGADPVKTNSDAEVLPWGKGSAQAATGSARPLPPAAVPKPKRRADDDDDDWATKLFR